MREAARRDKKQKFTALLHHIDVDLLRNRQTVKKRMRAKLQAVKQELRKRWHKRVAENGEWLRSVVQGYFNYHAIPGNFEALRGFQREVARMWLAALRRRSQRDRHSWERFRPILERYLPVPQILHPLPEVRSTPCTQGRSRMR